MTSVPLLQFLPTGLFIPAEADILTGVQEDMNAIFGSDLNASLETPQGQMASSETAIISSSYAAFAQLVANMDPAYSSGRYQDAIGRFYFITRNPPEATVLQVTCAGGTGVSIPVGALVQDQNNNIYSCTQAGVIPNSGSIQLPFACTVVGPIPVPNSVSIYQSILKWDSATLVSGVEGAEVESRSAFEQRRQNSVAANSNNTNAAILGAVLQVPGVVSAYVIDNSTSSSAPIGGVTLGANSLYVCVSGGDPVAVATAIWLKKPPGCAYTGNTTETVYDTSTPYGSPGIPYSVTFETATNLPIFIAVNIKNSAVIPSNAMTLIQAAIENAFSGADGGLPAQIGINVISGRFMAGVAALGAWAQILSITLASTNNSTSAVFSGSISGTTMTVASFSSGSGTLAAGCGLVGANVSPGTTIINQLSGTAGQTGTYTVSLSQSASSGTIDSYIVNNFQGVININQMPTTSAAYITVNLI